MNFEIVCKTTAIEGNTHLHIATHKGHLNVVKSLLDNGATVDTKNKNGWTPLHVACETGQLEVVKCQRERLTKLSNFEIARD